MSLCLTPRVEALTRAFTGRRAPLFDTGRFDAARPALRQAVEGRRLLLAGAAGTIGSATLLDALRYDPAEVVVLDPNENNLAELVRTIRSASRPVRARVRVEPIAYGSPLAQAFLGAEAPFDLVLSFAALKHVRSERDGLSLSRMLAVNLVEADRFLGALRRHGHGAGGVFFVSTDKAADRVSLMGASKRAMEALLWAHTAPGAPASLLDGGDAPPLPRVTTTRFANVAFSDGSLPWAFFLRLDKHQPLAAPRDVRRYFVSPCEAGALCLLAATACPHRHVLVPHMDPARHAFSFVEIARAVLAERGLELAPYEDEDAARAAVDVELARGRYPVLLTRADTSGEKAMEVFAGAGEEAAPVGVPGALGIPARDPDRAPLSDLLTAVDEATRVPAAAARLLTAQGAGALVRALQRVVPELHHKDTGRSLDDRM